MTEIHNVIGEWQVLNPLQINAILPVLLWIRILVLEIPNMRVVKS